MSGSKKNSKQDNIERIKAKNRVNTIIAIILVIALYLAMQLVGITCPIKFLTGVSCPGCGMSRAILSAIKLDFSNAYTYHPLFWLPPVWILVYLFRKRLSSKIIKIITFTSILLFSIIYLYRMLLIHGNIVVFEPENGFIARLLHMI